MADVPARATSGGISLVSQSGGLLNAFAELTGNRGIGVNYLVSSGNEAGLEMADYIAYLADDPATTGHRLHHGGRQGRAPLPGRGRSGRPPQADGRAQARPQRIRAAGDARPYRHARRPARGLRGAVSQNGVALVDSIDALAETAALFDLRAAAAGRSRRDDDGLGRRDLADRRPRGSRRHQLSADPGGHQSASAENPRRRARLRQSARYRRSAAAAPGRQHHGGAAGAARRRGHRPRRPRARHAGGRLGLPSGSGRSAGGGGARRRASRCCSSPSCPTA